MTIKPEKIAAMRKNWEDFSTKVKARPGYAEKKAQFDKEYDIAAVLHKARKKAKLSQKELAEKLHTTQSVISRMESGNANITLARLQQYAEACGGKLQLKVAFPQHS